MHVRVLYWLGCMRFGEEKLRMSRYQERRMEVELYFRFWHPLMMIELVMLVSRLAVSINEFVNGFISLIKDDTICGCTLYRRLEKKNKL